MRKFLTPKLFVIFKGRHLLRKKIFSLSMLTVIVFLLSLVFFGLGFRLGILQDFNLQKKPLSGSVDSVVEICRDNLGWRDCYGRQIARLNYQMDFKDTLEILKGIAEVDAKTRDCHLISHKIAASEVDKAPEDWIKIFDYVDQTTCNNGFVHGVLEGRSKYDSSLVLDEKTIPSICKQIEDRTSARVGKTREGADDACAHIIGHILLAQEDAMTKNAVEICSKIPHDIRTGCFDGVFMENITRENLEAHEVAQKLELTKEESLGLEDNCRSFEGAAGRSCWRELAHIYTVIGHNDPNEVYPLCYQTPIQAYANECYMHSINLMILSDNYSDQNLTDTCKHYWNSEDRSKSCISRSLVPLLGSSVDFIDRAAVFCDSAPLEYKQFCYTKIGQEIKPRTSPERRVELCGRVPQEFFKYCNLEN